MKKLLTMMVSCASALFAMADVQLPTGTDFESYKVNDAGAVAGGPAIPLNINKDDNGEDGDRYWYSKTSTEGIVEAAVTNNGTTAYLMLDTSEVLERTIGGYTTSEGTTTFASTNLVGGAIYFDSKVQFTATEDDVTPSEGDKLVVWLKAVEASDAVMDGETVVRPAVSASTNLMITAGVPGEGTSINPVSYKVTNISVKPNDWARLTIKSFLKGGKPYFSVFVNGVAVETEVDVDNEFLSLVDSETEGYTTITSVGFKGNGAVDDLVFTKSNPLGFSVTATIADAGETGATAKYSVDGSTWVDVTSGSPFTVPASTASITFKVFIADGYELDGGTKTTEVDASESIAWTKTVSVSSVNNAITLTVKAAQVEPETGAFSIDGVEGSFATLAEAIAAAKAGDTIKLTADATVAEWLKVEKNVVLDLNGCTLTEEVDPEDFDYGAIYVKLNCQLTITDSSKDKNGKIASNGDIVIGNYGKVIVEAGTIESGDVRDNDVSIYNMNYAGTHVGTANINGGVVESVWNCGTINVAEGASVTYLDNSGAATIAADATVSNVVLMDGADAQGVVGAGTITAPNSIVVVSGVEGYTATYNEGVWSLVKDTDPEPEVPTVGETEVKFDETTGVITNITTAANNMDVSGVADPIKFLDSFAEYYTVDIVGGKLSIALNDEAKPVIGEANVDDDEAKEPAIQIVNGQFKVTIQDSYTALKYKLQYKAGLGNDPETGKPYSWTDVATEEVGTGDAMQLSAPVSGDKGFYRVVVED